MLHLHDTATGTIRPLEMRTEGEVSMYVCGPTVYDLPHIGHGRANLTFDILRRYLSFTGLRVRHVANVTDVDDNIIKRAADLGRTEADVAAEFEARWWESMDALGDLRPQDAPHATGYIERHGGAGRRPDGQGNGVRDTRRGLPRGVQGRRVRAPGAAVARVAAGRGAGRGQRGQALTPRLRPLEEGEGGRAELGLAVGAGPARVGTPSAWSCRSTCWARASTSTAAART